MTWFSLTDQVDWDAALREDNGRVNPLRLYDLDRNIRPVGRAYQELIRECSSTPLLPNGPLTLVGDWDLAVGPDGGEPDVARESAPSRHERHREPAQPR